MNHDDFPTLVRDRLHRAADDLALAPAGPDRAVVRARARRRGRHAAVAGCAAATLLAVTVAAFADQDDRTSVATEPDATAGAPIDFDWRPADDGLSNVRSSTIDPATGAIYALSTAPGVRDTAGTTHRVDTVYRLTDDGHWEPTRVGDQSARPARLAADGDALYAIGTAAGDASAVATVVTTSTDGGATWTEDVLREVTPPNRTLPWRRIETLGIAAAGGRQVAVATSVFLLDWNEIAGDPADDDSYVRGDVTDDGVRLVRETSGGDGGVVEEEIGFRTWADLDLPGPEVFDGSTSVFVREGTGWTEVDAGVGDEHVLSLRAVDGRFVLRTFTPSSPADGVAEATWVSPDGQAWTAVAAPGDPHGAVPVGDRFVGHDRDGIGLVASAGDGRWTSIDLGAVDERLQGGHVGTLAAGDLGLAFTVHGDDAGDSAHLVFTPDLRSWTVEPLADVLGEEVQWANLIEVGADRIVVVGTREDPGPAPARTVTAVGVPRR